MSALPPKADIGPQPRDVRFVPKADSCTAAIDAKDVGSHPPCVMGRCSAQSFTKKWGKPFEVGMSAMKSA